MAVALASVSVALTNLSRADEPPLVQPKVKSVAVFKNGLSFVIKSGETPLADGWARLDRLPPATLGTLWVGTGNKSNVVTDVIAYKDKETTNSDSLSMAELLANNSGHQVTLSYSEGANLLTANGILLPTPKAPGHGENEISSPVWQNQRPELRESDIVLLRATKAGTQESMVLAIRSSAIQSVEISGDANLHNKIEREVGRAKLHIAGNPARAEIVLACLEKGIVWSPSYRVNLADEKNATIDLDAILVDDQEDLDHSDVSFVVGYPNFMFSDIISPISLQQSVASFLQAMSTGQSERAMFNRSSFANSLRQMPNYNPDAEGGAAANYSSVAVTPGERSEDLYFYHKSGATLKKGDRARFNILSVTAPYEHVYEWEANDTMNVDAQGFRGNEQPPRTEDQVWHVLRLKNTGQQPWTTAPAFAVNNDKPVAEDTLNYTPPGGKSTLKLTVASDVHVEQSQKETSRRNLQIDTRHYDEVTVEGKLRLTNFKDKEVSLSIRKTLLGEVLEAPDGKISKVARNLTAINSNTEILWEFKLPAGENRELKYSYKVLLNR